MRIIKIFMAVIFILWVLLECKEPVDPVYEECIYIDPCTGQHRWVNCEWVQDMPDTCEDEDYVDF